MLDPRQPSLIEERFWAKIDVRGPDDCWLWQGALFLKGYGAFNSSDGRTNIASRRVIEDALGRRLERHEFACHSCDTPACCNPAHIWVGSAAENQKDMAAKGRHRFRSLTHCKAGHEFTPENTFRQSGGYRGCRICNRIWKEEYRQRVGNQKRREARAAKRAAASPESRQSEQSSPSREA